MSRRIFLSRSASTVAAGAITSPAVANIRQREQATIQLSLEAPAWPLDDWVTNLRATLNSTINTVSAGQIRVGMSALKRITDAGMTEPPATTVTAQILFDSGLQSLEPGLQSLQIDPFSTSSLDRVLWWFSEDASSVKNDLLQSGVRAFPLGLRPDSLGLWSTTPLHRPGDFRGQKIGAGNQTARLFERCGAKVVLTKPTDIREAFRVGDLDMVVSCGATLDEAMGLFDTTARCYTPSIRGAGAAAWLIFSNEQFQTLQTNCPDTEAILEHVSRSALISDYVYWEQQDRQTLLRQYDAGFAIHRIDSRLFDWLYQQSEQLHAANSVEPEVQARQVEKWHRRDGPTRLARGSRALYDGYLS